MGDDVRKDAVEFEGLLRQFVFLFQTRNMTSFKDVRMPQFKALLAIDKAGEVSMGDIARELGVTLGGATSFVDRLVEAGYAQRDHDEKDRRIVRVKLTPDGQKLTHEIMGIIVSYVEQVLSAVPAEECAQFLETFRKIVARAAQISA